MTPLPYPAPGNPVSGAPLPTRAMLVVLLAGASLAFSMAFACATPFAALAAVAALRLKHSDAFIAVSLAWLVNQADGYLFMHYPQTWDSFGWGAAIWLAAMTATFVALAAISMTRRLPLVMICVAPAAAFVAYESILRTAALVLPSSPGAFSLDVIARLLSINVMAFALLLASTLSLKIIDLTLKREPPLRASFTEPAETR